MTDLPESFLRQAAIRVREPDGGQALVRAADSIATWLDVTAERLRQDIPSWRSGVEAGQSRRSLPELIERHYGPALNVSRMLLSGPVAARTSGEQRAITERDATIVRLRDALHTVRESIRNQHPAESTLAIIGKALDDPDAPRFVNADLRAKLRRAAELCDKTAYFSRAEAERGVEVVLDRHGSQQQPYFCRVCFLWHLTSQVDTAPRREGAS